MIRRQFDEIFYKPKRVRGLDGFRALCVIMVLLDHADITSHLETGTLAVWTFFVISGFLVTPMLLDARLRVERGVSSRVQEYLLFVRDRAFRIFPLYYASLLAMVVMTVEFGSAGASEKIEGAIAWMLTYSTNVYIGFVRESWLGPLSHLWTLAVEQQFYFFFPALFIFIPSKFWRGALIAATICSIAASLLFFSDSELKLLVNPLSGFYAICLGGFAGILAKQNLSLLRNLPAVNCVMAALSAALIGQHLYFTIIDRTEFALLVTPILSSLLIVLITLNQNAGAIRFLEIPLIRGIGVVSYGFYLFHNLLLGPCGRAITLASGWSNGFAYKTLQVTLAFAITAVVSGVSFLYFEQRFTRFKKRYTVSAPIPI